MSVRRCAKPRSRRPGLHRGGGPARLQGMDRDDIRGRFAGLLQRDWAALHRFETAERASARARTTAEERCTDFMALYAAFDARARSGDTAELEASHRVARLAWRQRAFQRLPAAAPP